MGEHFIGLEVPSLPPPACFYILGDSLGSQKRSALCSIVPYLQRKGFLRLHLSDTTGVSSRSPARGSGGSDLPGAGLAAGAGPDTGAQHLLNAPASPWSQLVSRGTPALQGQRLLAQLPALLSLSSPVWVGSVNHRSEPSH